MSTEIWNFLPSSVNVSPSTKFTTLISAFEDGAEQRRRKVQNERNAFELNYGVLTKEQYKSMQDFYIARSGAFDNFLFEHLADSPNVNQFLGAAAGNTYLLDGPSVPLSEIISVDSVVQTRGVDYTIDDGTGTITFGVGLPAGTTVQANTYQFYWVVRFGDDILRADSIFRSDVFSLKVGLIQDPGQQNG